MQISKLWHTDQHSAFTDLIFYNQAWFCVFREASGHMSFDGKIRVLSSNDAKSWQLHSTLSFAGGDLRDPKLSISPENKLIMSAGIRWAVFPATNARLYSIGYQLAPDNQAWLAPVMDFNAPTTWRWASSWQQNFAYSVGYSGADRAGCLYRSADGLNWQSWVPNFFPNPKIYSNESSLIFVQEVAYCLVRRDGRKNRKAVLGKALPPYKNWQWQQLAKHIGGPKMLQLSNGEIVVAGRYINFKRWRAKTVIYKLNPANGKLKLWRTLPSTGDTSYPGLVEQNQQLFVSYYSTNQQRETEILLAKIPLIQKKRSRKFQ